MSVVDLSVVIPVYGCSPCLVALHERLCAVLAHLGVRYEVIYIDDRSPDGAWCVLEEIAASYPHVRLIRLSRNFGQHAAITAGLSRTRGEWVVVMDCDLQDEPETIPTLLNTAREGFDIVFARRASRHDSSLRRLGSRAYFWMLAALFRSKMDGEYGTFSIISRRVVDAYLELKDVDRHYLFILRWLGFEHAVVDVEQAPRYAGRSSYTFSRLVQHAFDGLVFQSTQLLRWIVYLGFGIAAVGAGLAAYFVLSWILRDPYPGWTSLAVLLLLLGGFIILSLGVTGLYVGKIFAQVKGRPLYVIDKERDEGHAGLDDRDDRGLQSAQLSTIER